jgi:hypothetical protein
MAVDEIKNRYVALRPGDSGILVTDAELRALEISGVAEMDLKTRAEWLRKQLSPSCVVKEGAMTGGWVFSRPPN